MLKPGTAGKWPFSRDLACHVDRSGTQTHAPSMTAQGLQCPDNADCKRMLTSIEFDVIRSGSSHVTVHFSCFLEGLWAISQSLKCYMVLELFLTRLAYFGYRAPLFRISRVWRHKLDIYLRDMEFLRAMGRKGWSTLISGLLMPPFE